MKESFKQEGRRIQIDEMLRDFSGFEVARPPEAKFDGEQSFSPKKSFLPLKFNCALIPLGCTSSWRLKTNCSGTELG